MAGPSWKSPAPRHHGGALAAELDALGLAPEEVLDFSVNVNPYGPCAEVLAAARSAPVHLYPDPTAAAVRRAVAARTGVAPDEVVFGAGAADLLWTLCRVVFAGGAAAFAVEPAFSEFGAAAEAAGARLHGWRARPEDGFAPDLAAAATAAERAGAAGVYLCAPTTPVGAPVPLAGVAALAERLAGTLVILDESFLSLSDQAGESALPLPPNVVRLRSITKEHAIPGLRAGYLLAPAALARAVEASRPAWSTSSAAQAAAIAALGADGFVAACRARLREDREVTAAGLRALGLAPLPSIAPYLVFPAGDAAGLRARLLRRRVLVRDCASFGLSGFLRVAVRPASERERLLEALAQELR
ncbi:MAG TPA: aminotransferase class I/II-fold pyridoxal phosphate-dependent enzyme [Anaeromyxobacteraceae bacterium]|jgi:histidinol-phosphate/aromatic aminotransferase/cobyric acid decarboxylase-like protein|nr:aminotransferase class I/II-fold pyridoxal phosphate-dependent enzyme [Anaeromyxobacteraceae bacterium]